MEKTKSLFKHYPNRPAHMTVPFVKREYKKLLNNISAADSSDSPRRWIELFADWNALKSYMDSEAARINYAYSKDMTNKTLENQERYIREKISPAISESEHALTKALLSSRHKSAVGEHYGRHLITEYELALKPMDPVNKDLRVQASHISTQYDKVLAKAMVKVRGKKINLWKARSLQFSPDRSLRQEAFLAVGDWILENHQQLAGFYAGLVKLRDEMAANLDYDSYVKMAYPSRGRTDYGEEEVEKFRQLVLRHVVPLYKQYVSGQTKALGVETLKPWDINYDPDSSLPLGIVPTSDQLDKAGQVFSRLSPVFAGYFEKMRRLGLIDLETRPNKQSGAYCTQFSDEEKVAILCNSTGDPDDIRVLVHEMGHAFQCWESQYIESVELHWGTADLAEIFSMGMEFLSLPYMEEFFSRQDSIKFSKGKWAETLYTLCYVSVVDEFQHWVYEHPQASIDERDRQWQKIYSKYLGAVDFSGAEKYRKVRWYLQPHIFSVPFYYIDYALAEVCAMQLGLVSQEDQKQAVDTYQRLARLGGTKSFLSAVTSGGLESPFEEATIQKLMKHVESILI